MPRCGRSSWADSRHPGRGGAEVRRDGGHVRRGRDHGAVRGAGGAGGPCPAGLPCGDAATIAGLSEKLAISASCEVSQLVVGDVGAMEHFADASFDVVGSDTVVAMRGGALHRPFSEILRVLRPGGALVLRELLPPGPAGTTRHDLFLPVMLSARAVIGDGYAMSPPALVASVLHDVGLNHPTDRTVHELEEKPVPAQRYPLGSPSFRLAEAFADYSLEQSRAARSAADRPGIVPPGGPSPGRRGPLKPAAPHTAAGEGQWAE